MCDEQTGNIPYKDLVDEKICWIEEWSGAYGEDDDGDVNKDDPITDGWEYGARECNKFGPCYGSDGTGKESGDPNHKECAAHDEDGGTTGGFCNCGVWDRLSEEDEGERNSLKADFRIPMIGDFRWTNTPTYWHW
jgi:hypothetical protein